ncbi:putative odorant receptor 92a [Anoplophora glabripennis]|uniref:putative odorant receptor 92a n=1 Tax=Anoplophora glabripennis TaxID=217634 RepID=UPI000C774CF7|nr:putative odorant receptor 92a [Anoplophora glabripennis]
MPFEIDYFPMRQILLVVQMFGAHQFYMIAGMCAWFVFETFQHFRIRIRHVNFLFQEAIKEEDPQRCREKFHHAARYHALLLGLGDRMNGAFGIFMFTHMAITAPIIGIGVFAIVSGGSVSSFLLCLGWFDGLAMVCFAGQWLQDECIAVGIDLYDADWLHCPEDIKKDMMVVIQRSWTPICLRASSFGIMDYRMFLGVKIYLTD